MNFTKTLITYTGPEMFNDYVEPQNWKDAFCCAEVGAQYTSLSNDLGQPVMQDTPMEQFIAQDLYSALAEYTNPKVLIIGWGIAFINNEVFAHTSDVVWVEKYQEVVDLTPPENGENIIISDINDLDLSQLSTGYDIIYNDISERNDRLDELETLLSENGKLLTWRFKAEDDLQAWLAEGE